MTLNYYWLYSKFEKTIQFSKHLQNFTFHSENTRISAITFCYCQVVNSFLGIEQIEVFSRFHHFELQRFLALEMVKNSMKSYVHWKSLYWNMEEKNCNATECSLQSVAFDWRIVKKSILAWIKSGLFEVLVPIFNKCRQIALKLFLHDFYLYTKEFLPLKFGEKIIIRMNFDVISFSSP